jgi:ubiquinone/menaquinone biosynthesis C-methylase UbiE
MAIWVWVILAVVLLILITLSVGWRHLNVPRKISPEGLEDDEVVLAYDKISRWPQFKLIRWFIVTELKRHNPQGILADIGCGPGYLITNMAKSLPHLSIIGVDISQKMVQKAALNLSSLRLVEKVSFRQGDIQNLPFEINSLDFVVSTFSLHHWSEPKQAVHEIYRVLKPGGQFLIFDLRRDSRLLVYWIIKFAQRFVMPSVMKRANEPTGSLLASYTPVELESFLSRTSFQQRKIKPGFGWVSVWGCKG